ncbi:MAG: exodeoxyribonuclease III [Candidatus Eiseniibacteriota bacterium]|jgi:exodeoxyribonuclease-3
MRIATWNVNSIRTRLERALSWVERHEPDVLCLQELKVQDASFPRDAFEAAGYHALVFGQKTYNGVAILARSEPVEIRRGLGPDPGADADDPQARLLGGRVDGVSIYSVYVPNGSEIGSEKYAYKLDWLRRLHAMLEQEHEPEDDLLLCGDFNIAHDEKDVANPENWTDSVLFHPDMRAELGKLHDWGLVDTFRLHHPDGRTYSWWDYRMLAFPRNEGLKIDHILATRGMAERCTAASIDRDERKGKKPSDHAPVIAEFE